jgi:hypothetical protein
LVSQRTREELTPLIEGGLSTALAKHELIKLAIRLIVAKELQGEADDAIEWQFKQLTAGTPFLAGTSGNIEHCT